MKALFLIYIFLLSFGGPISTKVWAQSTDPVNCKLSFNSFQLQAQCVQGNNNQVLGELNQSLLKRSCDMVSPKTYTSENPNAAACQDLFNEACNKVPVPDNDCAVPISGRESAETPGGSLAALQGAGNGSSENYLDRLVTDITPVCNRMRNEVCTYFKSCTSNVCRRDYAVMVLRSWSPDKVEAQRAAITREIEEADEADKPRARQAAARHLNNIEDIITIKRRYAERVTNTVYGSGTGVDAGNEQYRTARRAFEEAQESMRMAIRKQQDPPLTLAHKRALVRKIDETLFPTPAEYTRQFMHNFIEHDCFTGAQDYGANRALYLNAVNQSHPNFGGTPSALDYGTGTATRNPLGSHTRIIVPCAGMFHAKLPYLNLVHTFAHELSHSIDPCAMEVDSIMADATAKVTEIKRLNTAREERINAIKARIAALPQDANYARDKAALEKSILWISPAPDIPKQFCQGVNATPRPGGSPIYYQTYRDAGSGAPNFTGVYNNLLSCFQSQHSVQAQTFSTENATRCNNLEPRATCLAQAVPHCNALRKQGLDPAGCGDKQLQQDQNGETFADWFAAQALAFSIKSRVDDQSKTPAIRNTTDVHNIVKNIAGTSECPSARAICCSSGVLKSDCQRAKGLLETLSDHPTSYQRVNGILGTDHYLRRLMGCNQNPEATTTTLEGKTKTVSRKTCTLRP